MILFRNRSFACACLASLLLGAFALDFAHGVALGESRQLFHPVYRIRQTLAVALSRMHPPYAHGYLAFGSIVDGMSEHGFAVFGNDKGPSPGLELWEKTLTHGAALNQGLREVQAAPVNPLLPPGLIRGNELGYADFMWGAFRIFGLKIESLYYFYFLILGTSCLLYAIEFRREAFLLHVLVVYLALVYFLIDYAHDGGLQLNCLQNSRLFSALTLPAAAHVFFVLWLGRRPRPATVAMVAAQCAIFSFAITCRYEAMWQVLMIVATAIGMASRSAGARRAILRPLWPAALLVLLVAAGNLQINLSADRLYSTEPKTHILWHELLIGLLNSSSDLRREYLGVDPGANYSDTMAYDAVKRDLTLRHDASSPIAGWSQGRIVISFDAYLYYDRLARSLFWRIILRHPMAAICGLRQKVRDQFADFEIETRQPLNNFRVPAVMILLGTGACLFAGGLAGGWRTALDGIVVLAIFLLFASVTPAIEPSVLAVGSLLCYLGAGVIAVSGGAAILAGWILLPSRDEAEA